MGAVDVGDEVHLQVILVGAQGLGDHDGAQIGATNADVDHVLDGLAGIALPLATDDLLAEALHLGQYGVHFRHHVLAVNLDGTVGAVAQGGVQYGASFGHVDLVAVEHGVDGAAQIGLASQVHQQLEGLFGDQVLGVVDQDVATEGEGELVKTLGILCEQILETHLLVGCKMGFQCLPGLGPGWIDIFHRIISLPSCV